MSIPEYLHTRELSTFRSIEPNPTDALVYGSDIITMCFELLKRGRSEDVDLIYKEASKMHLFMSRYENVSARFSKTTINAIRQAVFFN